MPFYNFFIVFYKIIKYEFKKNSIKAAKMLKQLAAYCYFLPITNFPKISFKTVPNG